MRRISLNSVRPGMVLAKAVIGGKGQVLLNTGVEIKPQYLTYLKQLGINHLYVQNSNMKDVESMDLIRDETKREAQSLVADIMNDVQMGTSKRKGINLKDNKILMTVSKIIEELLKNKDMIVQLQDIRALNDYIFAHSVNCCVIATLVAVKMNYRKETLKELATGALLHDLGMVAIPKYILNKRGVLTKEGYEIVKRHPYYGYEILKNSPLFSAGAGDIIVHHHERFQGQGYPQGLQGGNISSLAQTVGIVDVYDSLTSERPYRKAFQPHQALELIMSWGETSFDLTIMNSFLSSIAAYPLGTQVYLSNGESGLVIANNADLTLRPVVRVLFTGEDLAPHPSPYDLDLSQYLDLTIIRVLD